MYKRAVAATAVCKAVDAVDGVSAKTGLTVTGKISKDGAAFATLATPVTEIGLGWYLVTLTGTEMTAESVALDLSAVGALIAGIPIHTENDYTVTRAGYLDAALSSRLASAGYTAPDNATITAIASYVDTEVAAIKAKTDQLVFTVANQLDANIHGVNNVTVTGAGTTGSPWGP